MPRRPSRRSRKVESRTEIVVFNAWSGVKKNVLHKKTKQCPGDACRRLRRRAGRRLRRSRSPKRRYRSNAEAYAPSAEPSAYGLRPLRRRRLRPLRRAAEPPPTPPPSLRGSNQSYCRTGCIERQLTPSTSKCRIPIRRRAPAYAPSAEPPAYAPSAEPPPTPPPPLRGLKNNITAAQAALRSTRALKM